MNSRPGLTLLSLLAVMTTFEARAQKNSAVSLNAVKTESGLISGIRGTDKSVMVFKGIPFASPPVGELRWKEPQPVKSWDGVRKCDRFGPNAMQAKPVTFMVWTPEFLIPPNDPMSEDCLYLNVWTRAKSASQKSPVIVFIHGGGFTGGSGSVPIYDGEAMAKKGIVFVTVNYRLGVFGFFAHPELTKASPNHTSGNYGILDQIAALKWVQKNIAAFGGDPANVTIAGQSAGSMSVNLLSASPLAKGLFAKIIAESGAAVVKGMLDLVIPLDTAEARGIQFQKMARAADFKQLQEMPADKLFSLFRGRGNPVVDGYMLPESVAQIFSKGNQANVPLLTGYNGDDIVFSGSAMFGPYKEFVRNQFGGDSDIILKYYPGGEEGIGKKGPDDLARDLTFGLQNFSWALMQSEQGKANSYLYFFNRKVPIYKDSTNYGAFHTGEVSYAYDNLRFLNRPLVKADHDLAKLMSSYWANFAKTGNPNGAGLPQWPVFNKEKGDTMIFDSTAAVKKHPFFEVLKLLYERAARQ